MGRQLVGPPGAGPQLQSGRSQSASLLCLCLRLDPSRPAKGTLLVSYVLISNLSTYLLDGGDSLDFTFLAWFPSSVERPGLLFVSGSTDPFAGRDGSFRPEFWQ